MKYERADEIFPTELLCELQKYISEGLVYFPKPKDKRAGWGEANGEKERIKIRNTEINNSFRQRLLSIEQLAQEYHLSIETIKNIVYRS